MVQLSWNKVFHPTWEPGGLAATNRSVNSRMFDNFESPATTGTISAAWTGTNVTVTKETTSPIRGEGSMKVVVAGGAGSVYKVLDNAKFTYPFPGHNGFSIRYITFKAKVTSGTATLRATLADASDANLYRYWSFTISTDGTVTYVIDLDPDNTEGYPSPTTGSTSWDAELIDRFGFTNLTSGTTYYFDDVEFWYEVPLEDTVGFSTEAPVTMGNVGSLNAKLNGMWGDILAIETQTQQYAKQGLAVAEIGQACQWALELNSEFAPPTTTEIEPGVYQIDRIRGAVTTNIVASTPASESTGTIYASYTPTETNWNVGDLIKVTFSGGYIRTDTAPLNTLTGNASSGQATIQVDNAYEYHVGWTIRVYDDATPAGEYLTISALTSPTVITCTTNLSNSYTTAQNAKVTRIVRTDLSTAVFFTMLQSEAQTYRILAVGTFTTSSATVPADTGRTESADYWNGTWLIPITGNVANQPRLIVDFTNVTGVFTIDAQQPFTAETGEVEYIIVGPNSQLTPAADATTNTTPAHVIGNKADTIPAMNLAPSATDSLVRHIKAILERVGATPADPDDSVLTNIGQRDDTATLDDLTDVTTTSIQAKLRRLLLRFSSNAFAATIQGASQTDVESMLGSLATYFSAAGAAMALQVNNNTARTNLEQALLDYFTVVGCNGTNVFSTTIQGAARTTVEATFDALATYLSAAGAAYSATVDPGGSARTNVEQTLEDIGQMLAGSSGITTFPTGVAPGNAVSLAEVIRYISDNVVAFGTLSETGGTLTSSAAEQNVIIVDAPSGIFEPKCVKIDLTNMIAGDTVVIKLYYRIKSGGSYILEDSDTFNDDVSPALINIDLTPNRYGFNVTLQQTAGTNRNYDYEYIYED